MRRLIFIFLLLISLFYLFSCRKDKKVNSDNYVKFEKIDSSDVSQFKIKVSTSITCSNLFTIKSKGFCWSKYHMPSIKDSVIYINSNSNSFSFLVQNLNVNTKYYFRSFATNEMGIYYSDEFEYKTLDYQPVLIKTISPFNISRDSVVSGGLILNNGGSFVTEKGICWSTSIFPSKQTNPSPNFIISGSGDSNFFATLKNLTANQSYHIRSYAINIKGISYGDDQFFQTSQPDLPQIAIIPISNVSKTSANSGVTIFSDGGSSIGEVGLVWGLNSMPDIFSLNKINDLTPNINSYFILKNLIPNTQYYLRAYAINSVGVSYSNQLIFTTLPPTLPIVFTLSNKTITSANAILNINVSSDGGVLLQSKGVVIGNNSNLDLNNYLQILSMSTSDTGNFSFQFSNLTPGTLYYYRSFASNTLGVSYGNILNFTTLSTAPSLSLSNPSIISSNIYNFNVFNINDGGSMITSRGVVWDVNPNPTQNLSTKLIDGNTGASNFNSIVNSFNPGYTYYIRAFATNSIGTSYSNQVIITTPSLPSINSYPSSYCITSNSVANLNCAIFSDGGSAIINKGFYCSDNAFPTAANSFGFFVPSSNSSNLNISGVYNGLLPGYNSYYIRPFATNSVGTSYGPSIQFGLFDQLSNIYCNSPANSQVFTLSVQPCYTFSFTPPTNNGLQNGSILNCRADTLELNICRNSLFSFANQYNSNSNPLAPLNNNIYKIPISPCVSVTSAMLQVNCVNLNSSILGIWFWKGRLISGSIMGPWSATRSFTLNP